MTCQFLADGLNVDCLNEIFEHLEDIFTLHSCLLVNRLWCEVSVRILWRNVHKYYVPMHHKSRIISTLIVCLPDETKDLLYKNDILISTSTWKPPLFNYASFFKVLSIRELDQMIQHVLEEDRPHIVTRYYYTRHLDRKSVV